MKKASMILVLFSAFSCKHMQSCRGTGKLYDLAGPLLFDTLYTGRDSLSSEFRIEGIETDKNGDISYKDLLYRYSFRKVKLDSDHYYLVQGDMLMDSLELIAYIISLQKRNREYQRIEKKAHTQPYMVGIIGDDGKPVKWDTSDIPVKYAINKASFGIKYSHIKYLFKEAASEWGNVCSIRFHHVESADELNLDEPNDVVDFIVRYDPDQKDEAYALFPNTPKRKRKLLLGPQFFNSVIGYTPHRIMLHELGHIIGFRHEHIREEAPVECLSETLDGTIPVTDYDAHSIMHYFCGRNGSLYRGLSDLDKKAAKKYYP